MKSSLGFHTMTLSLSICRGEYFDLIRDFTDYAKRTHEVRMYLVDQKNLNHHLDASAPYLPLKTRITFVKHKGITWLLKNISGQYSVYDYTVEVTINPKCLAGIETYVTAATLQDMNKAIRSFNSISQSISPVLKEFMDYTISRIDYCVNFAVSELTPGCTYEQIMNLIKRSNVPPRFKEWNYYDDISHRTKTKPGSFYLMNRSVHINCYSKYVKLSEQSTQNKNHGYPPIRPNVLEASKDIIRFEVQCKYIKTHKLIHSIDDNTDPSYNKYRSLLDPLFCKDIIVKYYWNTIGKGDWYSLSEAITKINEQHFNTQKQSRLIGAIKLINSCRGIARARENLSGNKLRVFNLTLKDLMNLGINPVTIPREWGIPYIKNPLNEFIKRFTFYPYSVEEKTVKETSEKDV